MEKIQNTLPRMRRDLTLDKTILLWTCVRESMTVKAKIKNQSIRDGRKIV